MDTRLLKWCDDETQVVHPDKGIDLLVAKIMDIYLGVLL